MLPLASRAHRWPAGGFGSLGSCWPQPGTAVAMATRRSSEEMVILVIAFSFAACEPCHEDDDGSGSHVADQEHVPGDAEILPCPAPVTGAGCSSGPQQEPDGHQTDHHEIDDDQIVEPRETIATTAHVDVRVQFEVVTPAVLWIIHLSPPLNSQCHPWIFIFPSQGHLQRGDPRGARSCR